MKIVNYVYDPQILADLYEDAKGTFEEKNPGQSFDEQIGRIALRYLKSEQKAYLRFGVYWGGGFKSVKKT